MRINDGGITRISLILRAEKFKLELLENALDSLDEGIERFLLNRRPSDLKYSVLHIAQAVELFLKARLVREHPLLIYVNPAKAGDDPKRLLISMISLGG